MKLPMSHRKCLASILMLEEKGFMASSIGVYQFLKGSSEAESKRDLAMYGCLKSITKRRTTLMLKTLNEQEFIDKIFVDRENEFYFRLTSMGKAIAIENCSNIKNKNRASIELEKKSPFIRID